jgi:hypothetical protein
VTSGSGKSGTTLPSGVRIDGTGIGLPEGRWSKVIAAGGQLLGELDEHPEGLRIAERAGAGDILGRRAREQPFHGDLETLAVEVFGIAGTCRIRSGAWRGELGCTGLAHDQLPELVVRSSPRQHDEQQELALLIEPTGVDDQTRPRREARPRPDKLARADAHAAG